MTNVPRTVPALFCGVIEKPNLEIPVCEMLTVIVYVLPGMYHAAGIFEVIILSWAVEVPAWQPDFAQVTPSEGEPDALSGAPAALECVLVLSNNRDVATTIMQTKKKYIFFIK